MLTQTVSLTKTGRLILVRLLAPEKPTNVPALRRTLAFVFEGRPADVWKALFDETFANLEQHGLVTREPLGLTDAGREQALEFLGLSSLPADADWKALKNKYLVPATFAGPADDARRERLSDADGLRLAVLQARYDLPNVKSLNEAIDALVCHELDLEPEEKLTFSAVKAKILARMLNVVGNPPLKEIERQLPAHAIGAEGGGADDLRSALLREWLKEDAPAAPSPAETEQRPASEHGPSAGVGGAP
jgi:hypothetical protein